MRFVLVLSCVALLCGGFAQRGAASKTTTHRIYTHDFLTATKIVGRYYGSNVRNWLVNCSSSEGGHGGFVWYGHYSHPIYGYSTTPGGWMQFMQSTFDNNRWWALRDARRRGLRIHPRAYSYYEPLGQAVVAGAMYYYHGNHGTWTGGYC